MISVTNKPIIVSVVVLNVVMLGVVTTLVYYINCSFSVYYESTMFYSIVPGLFKYFVQQKKNFSAFLQNMIMDESSGQIFAQKLKTNKTCNIKCFVSVILC